jgi:hypothetical protein
LEESTCSGHSDVTEHIDVVCVHDNEDFSAAIEYTFALILSSLDLRHKVMSLHQARQEVHSPDKGLLLTYAPAFVDLGADKQIHIYASRLFGRNYLEPNSLPPTPLREYDGLPVIYRGRGNQEALVRKTGGLIETNIDIIASSFFMLSRYEEVVLDIKDEHSRFPASASLAFGEGFLNRPIVNEYIELLWSWLHSLEPGLTRKPLWPENKEFAVCLTHDVDHLRRYSFLPPVRRIGGAVLRGGDLRLGSNIAIDYLRTLFHLRKDPFDTFDYILDLEHRFGFTSSFYFMAGRSSKLDVKYSILEPRVVELLRQIEHKGCEAGAHASYNSYNSPEHMVSEKARLDRVAGGDDCGCRQHYLRWKAPYTWQAQESAGLLYDATVGFADHAGFRCGFCLPFEPFDIIRDRKLSIWELPLTLQENTLKRAEYQNLSPEEAYNETVGLIQAVKRCHGVFVLLWHNSSFDSLGGWAGWKEVYERLMEHIAEQNAWVTSGRGIILWWKQRVSMVNNKPVID